MKAGSDNIVYYNAIANEYNDMLDKKPDRIIREKVATTFCTIVKDAVVLDFGGGTGLDLRWLSDKNHTIYFCEPSAGMRETAIRNCAGLLHNVIFLDDLSSDFRQWHLHPPLPVKADAVLSNFAVLNCIPDIAVLFENLATVVKPGGNFMALVLTKSLKKMLSRNLYSTVKSFIHNTPASINIRYKKHRQTVYIHSIKEIIKASQNYFDFCSNEVLHTAGFTLIHLKRNEKLI